MATASVSTITETRRVFIPGHYEDETVTRPTGEIVLTLTEREALVLKRVTQRIAGDPETTDRKHTDAIGRAISEALGLRGLAPVTSAQVPIKGNLELGVEGW